MAITSKLGCSPDSLRAWCQQAERDAGIRDGLSSDEKERFKALERENRELRQASEILKKASAYFAPPLGDASIACRACLHALPVNGIKTELINFLGPWKTSGQVEWETLKWVDWYNTKRLHSAIGYITPQEAEEAFYANINKLDKVA